MDAVQPHELRVHVRKLEQWEASASHLFDELRTQHTDARLMTITEADYGADAAEHLTALREMCETGR